jgi:hypothetical protein
MAMGNRRIRNTSTMGSTTNIVNNGQFTEMDGWMVQQIGFAPK